MVGLLSLCKILCAVVLSLLLCPFAYIASCLLEQLLEGESQDNSFQPFLVHLFLLYLNQSIIRDFYYSISYPNSSEDIYSSASSLSTFDSIRSPGLFFPIAFDVGAVTIASFDRVVVLRVGVLFSIGLSYLSSIAGQESFLRCISSCLSLRACWRAKLLVTPGQKPVRQFFYSNSKRSKAGIHRQSRLTYHRQQGR